MLFDAHGDILTDLYQQRKQGNKESFRQRHLALYRQAGITHSIFVNWTNPDSTDPTLFDAIFDHALADLEAMDDLFHIVLRYDDLAIAMEQHKIGVILGIEGLSQLRDVEHLAHYYRLGVRHATLTWNEVNRYGGGLSSETQGLTTAGRDIVRFMEEHGMIIDLAHTNAKTFQDILDATTVPLIISHGNVKALCDHRRNYTDDQLRAIADRGGVVGICGIAPFLATEEDQRTVGKMAEHIDYAVRLLGIDHVGVGFDVCYYLSDGVTSNHVEGFQTIGDAGNVFDQLRRMGYNEEQIEQIRFGNFARIVQQILG
jgi:membrane dipeptidase